MESEFCGAAHLESGFSWRGNSPPGCFSCSWAANGLLALLLSLWGARTDLASAASLMITHVFTSGVTLRTAGHLECTFTAQHGRKKLFTDQ